MFKRFLLNNITLFLRESLILLVSVSLNTKEVYKSRLRTPNFFQRFNSVLYGTLSLSSFVY